MTKDKCALFLLIVLILLLLGAPPTWPYSTGWGYYPSGGLGFGAADYCYPSSRKENLNLGACKTRYSVPPDTISASNR
jgi:hypothetical protein